MAITFLQWKFLAERRLHKTDKEAAEAIGINPGTITNWKLYDPEFAEEYKAAEADGKRICQEITRHALGKAGVRVTELLDAKRDNNARLGAAKLLFQMHGLLKEHKVVEGNPDNPVEMRVNIVRSTGNRKIDNAAGETPSPGTDS